MHYSAEISRVRPTCFVFLIDRSGSMADAIGGNSEKKKADVVADAINRLLYSLIYRCSKDEGVRDYFHIAVIGYGSRVDFALGGSLSGRQLIAISEVANHPLRVEQRKKKEDDGAGGIVEQTIKFPVWFEPVADGSTPMCQALDLAVEVVGAFIRQNPQSFPPIVINITDGEATDGDPEPKANAIRALTTDDGNVLLFNLHVSATQAPAVQFPSSETALPADRFARMLFRMSSPLPPLALAAARHEGIPVGESARGFVFNADLVSVVQFLDIGTRVDRNLQR